MDAGDIGEILKELPGSKSRFLLSELKSITKSSVSPRALLNEVREHLSALHLGAAPLGSDWVIYRRTPLVLSAEEREEFVLKGKRGLPPSLEGLIREYVAKKTGKHWEDPLVLERLRRAIQAQKGGYWQRSPGKDISYRKGYATLAYLAYHLPVYFLQTQKILLDLAADGLLPEYVQVLDAGSGTGVVTLAIADFYQALGRGEVWVHSIERAEEAREAGRFLTRGYADPARVHVHPTVDADLRDLSGVKIPDGLDLILFSNVLNEISATDAEERARVVRAAAAHLHVQGSIVIVEPADRTNSTELRRTSALLTQQGLHIHSPCTFLWGGTCRAKECWTFEELPSFPPTPLMLALGGAHERFRYVNTDIKFSVTVVRRDDRTRVCFRVPRNAKASRLSHLARHVRRRINIIAAVMSGDLGDAGTRVLKICDGSPVQPVYLMVPRHLHTPSTEVLETVPYGGIVRVQNVLVRWNDAHRAYNLLVTRGTTVAQEGDGILRPDAGPDGSAEHG